MQQIEVQGTMFIMSLILGAGMGLAYDVLRSIRRIIPHNNIIIAIEDLLFWVAACPVIIYYIQIYNYGIVRWYIFAAIIIGTFVYEITISCVWMKLLNYMLYHVKKSIKKCISILKNVKKKVKIMLTHMGMGADKKGIKRKKVDGDGKKL